MTTGTTQRSGPLDGLRVLELATGVAGPYAGRLFAMLGATVVKVEPDGGDPTRRLPVDHRPLPGISPLFVHLNAGKRSVLDTGLEVDAALAWADVVVDDRVRRDVRDTGADPDRLRAAGRRQVLVSVTAWGFDADDAGHPQDELVVLAASGLMAATAGDGEPLRFPGWQSQYLAGGYIAAGALAALAQADGGFHHVEVTWVGAILSGVEAAASVHLHQAGGNDDPSQAGIQSLTFPSGAFRCADGHVIPGTVRPLDWDLQCQLYGRPDLVSDERFGFFRRWQHRDEIRREIQPWYDGRTKREILEAALDVGWAAAMVMTAGDALEDPHLAERQFFSPLTGGPAEAVVPGRPWRASDVAEGEPVRLADLGEDTARFATDAGRPRTDETPIPGDLFGCRVLELTLAWAGPFVGRFLGAFGADVVRVEAGRWPDGWRTRMRWRRAGVTVPDGVDPESHTWDAAALFNGLNRNKRSLSLDLSRPEGRDVFVDLLAAADVLVVNMTHHVLAQRGVEDEVRAAVERGLVAITMPALGATGRYRAMPGYGSLMEGMGGFAARFGGAEEQAGASGTYYPDAVAGLHGAVAVLSALAAKAAHGRGSFIDLSQQETMWMQLGEAIVLRSTEGREPDRLGNAEPGCVPSGLVPTSDGGWVAVTSGGDGRLRAEPVRTFHDARRDATFDRRGLLEVVEHPVTGRRTYLGIPIRVDGASLATRRPAPVFGEHTDEVLADWLDMAPDQCQSLRATEAAGTTPTR